MVAFTDRTIKEFLIKGFKHKKDSIIESILKENPHFVRENIIKGYGYTGKDPLTLLCAICYFEIIQDLSAEEGKGHLLSSEFLPYLTDIDMYEITIMVKGLIHIGFLEERLIFKGMDQGPTIIVGNRANPLYKEMYRVVFALLFAGLNKEEVEKTLKNNKRK